MALLTGVSINPRVLGMAEWRALVTRILLVDDELDIVYLFALILEDKGYVTDTYTDPLKAFSEFKSNYYDLLILDYRMAPLNGLQLFQKIRALDSSVKAMLLTAAHEQLEVDENLKWFSRILVKPIAARELLEEVAVALEKK